MEGRQAPQYRFISPDLSLLPHWQTAPINYQTEEEIKRECLALLTSRNPLFRHMVNIKLVKNPRRNFINLILRQDMIYYEYKNNHYHCFFVSNKFEPYIIVTVLHKFDGPVVKLTPEMVTELHISVDTFISSRKIVNETYHYTTLAERLSTSEDGFSNANKSHSKKFHLKIRVPSDFIPMNMKAMQMLDLSQLRQTLEPVRYNFSRVNMSSKEVWDLIKNEAKENS